MEKKKHGDRRDATKLKMTGFDHLLNNFKHGSRSESEVFILKSFDVTELIKYAEKKKETNENITYFHLFATALAKTIYNRYCLNNYIIGGKKYHRNETTVSFVAKTKFNDKSKELLAVIPVLPNDNIDTISEKIYKRVKEIRTDNDKDSDTNNFVNTLNKLPGWLIKFMVWASRKLDNHDWLPHVVIDDDVYHSSIILSDLGAIHCDAIYHNLTDYGTNSIICTIGEIKEEPRYINGKLEKRSICDFGITLDERIADGFYFAKSLNLLEHIILNPSLLEEKASEKINEY